MRQPRNKQEFIPIRDGQMVIPIAVALARHDGDKVQYAIINSILQRLQSLITSSYKQMQEGGTQLSLCFDGIDGVGVVGKGSDYASEGSLQFDFRLRDLGIQPKHYPEAFDLLMKMSALQMQWEVDDPEHGHGMTTSPLFRPVYWNTHKVYDAGWEGTNDKAHYHWVYERGPSVTIVIEDWVARKIMSPASGIGKMLDIAKSFKSKFSIKLYWFFALHWRQFRKFQFTWQALRLQLGIDTFVEGTTRNSLKYRYAGDTYYIYTQNDEDILVRMAETKPNASGAKRKTRSFRWSEFERDVLKKVEYDFDYMRGKRGDVMEDGEMRIEYTLSHEVTSWKEVHRNNTTVKEPDTITFFLEYSPLGRQIIDGGNPVAEQLRIERMMEDTLFIQHSEAWNFTHDIPPADLPHLSAKVEALIAGLRTDTNPGNPNWDINKELAKIAASSASDTQKRQQRIRNIRNYTITSINDFIKKELPAIKSGFIPAEDVAAPNTPATPASQGKPSVPAAAFLAALRAARTGHPEEGDRYFNETLAALSIGTDGKTILLNGTSSTLTSAVEWYWNPADFHRLAATHGYEANN